MPFNNNINKAINGEVNPICNYAVGTRFINPGRGNNSAMLIPLEPLSNCAAGVPVIRYTMLLWAFA